MLYARVGARALGLPAPVLPDLDRPRRRLRAGLARARWDFLFYATFGVVVASSVRIAGVLLVFSYLIVPALAGDRARRLRRARACSSAGSSATLVSVLGMAASAAFDLPTGATVVCAFGLVLTVFGLAFRLGWLRAGPGLS